MYLLYDVLQLRTASLGNAFLVKRRNWRAAEDDIASLTIEQLENAAKAVAGGGVVDDANDGGVAESDAGGDDGAADGGTEVLADATVDGTTVDGGGVGESVDGADFCFPAEQPATAMKTKTRTAYARRVTPARLPTRRNIARSAAPRHAIARPNTDTASRRDGTGSCAARRDRPA